ncbi:unnamed protein product [Schistocephalus solidus]|uniref:Reverse transcriptase domain-containing protein n=1 Tax=Schistocephalus solidus TaxID=70667 RepID=A0A183SV52_SCHSO|nr:unnamed protein product [Schistocephalus solidus]
MQAFDMVNYGGLGKIMQKFGSLEQFTCMVRQLHDGMMVRANGNVMVSEVFLVTNGLKQGFWLPHTLSSRMFTAMLMHTYQDEHPVIRTPYITDGHLLNSQRMWAQRLFL